MGDFLLTDKAADIEIPGVGLRCESRSFPGLLVFERLPALASLLFDGGKLRPALFQIATVLLQPFIVFFPVYAREAEPPFPPRRLPDLLPKSPEFGLPFG
jgi:hypothetical protein